MNNKEQTIYINIDDSGKLSTKEEVCVYGATVFKSKKEKDKFITQYRKIIDSIKCDYCGQIKEACLNKCPEIKSYNIEEDDRRRVVNYLKKYFLGAVVIDNKKVYDAIMESKASKGRYLDYVLRRFIKGIICQLISNGDIDPNKKVTLVINIDEQSTKSNGYYTLREGLKEELLHGIVNFNYRKIHKPILNSELEILLTYQKSDKSYVVQGADMLAGLIRRKYLTDLREKNDKNQLYEYVDFKMFLP